ncbi:MAG: RIP metalloprotease RseP [Lentisphaeraceae bacterium]|nr:RIP metalloprotease RseP [Lentisphaeraceae bacterium]
MPDWLESVGLILFVVFFFGFSVFIHEFGHLLAAVWRGLHIEKFSIGFGQKIWGFKKNGIDFIIGWLPFGGYVQLPQLEPTDEPQSSDGRILPAPKAIDRVIVAVAGPLFNILFAFVLGTVLWKSGKPTSPPLEELIVRDIPQRSVDFKQGLRNGDNILSINGKKIKNSDQLMKEYVLSGEVTLVVERGDQEITVGPFVPEKNPNLEDLSLPPFMFTEKSKETKAIVGFVQHVDEQSGEVYPAYKAGVQEGDQFIRVSGKDINVPKDMTKAIQAEKGGPVNFTVLRDGKEVDLTITPMKVVRNLLGLRIAKYPHIFSASPEFSAYEAGVRKWDKIVAVNNVKLPDVDALKKILKENEGKDIVLEVDRDGVSKEFTMKVEHESYKIGVGFRRYYSYDDPLTQVSNVLNETFQTLGAVANRSVNLSGLSGPVGIGQGIYNQVKFGGWRAGLAFIFMINISLAIFNLLPLPVLDGGHIFIAILEMVSRKKLPASILQPVTMLFVLFFLSLMAYVTLHDVKRTGFEIIVVENPPEIRAPQNLC